MLALFHFLWKFGPGRFLRGWWDGSDLLPAASCLKQNGNVFAESFKVAIGCKDAHLVERIR